MTENSPTVRVLILRYLKYAEEVYRRPDGSLSTTIYSIRMALRVLRALYDEKPAAAFGPRALKKVREAMIARGWSRDTIATRIGIIRAMFKWAASEELIPAGVPAALATVAGLRRGQQGDRSGRKVRPAPQEQSSPRWPARQPSGCGRSSARSAWSSSPASLEP